MEFEKFMEARSGKFCGWLKAEDHILKNKETFKQTNPNQVNIYGAWAMGYFPEYNHLIPTHKISALHGRMKDGTRIASPGITQYLIQQTKKLLKSD